MPYSTTLAALLLVAQVTAASAQGRSVLLTGAPVATIDDPFTTITAIQEVAPGKVVVSDFGEKRLVLADLGTGSVRDIGRNGGGPGEWQIAMSVMPGPAGRVYVADPGLRRMHVVDATGKITSSLPFPGADGDPTPGASVMTVPRASDARGRLYFTGSPFTPGVRDQPDSVPIIRWDPQTRRTDTLGMIRNDTKVTQSGSPGAGNTTRVMARVGGGPFAPMPMWTPTRDGRVALVNPSPYRVDFIEEAGRIRRGTPVPYTPLKVTAADRDAYRERQKSSRPMVMRMGGGGSGVQSIGPSPGRDGVPSTPDSEFPATKPPFVGGNAVQVTPEGEVWVLRTRVAGDNTPTYDIFDSIGRLAGKATLKPNSTVVGFGAGAVYVSRQDPDDDLLYLEKYARN